jgi:hypothetical protein
MTSVLAQGCEQNGQLKASPITDLSDEMMRKVVFFALIHSIGRLQYRSRAGESIVNVVLCYVNQSPNTGAYNLTRCANAYYEQNSVKPVVKLIIRYE